MPNIKPIKPGQNPRAAEWNALAEAYNAGSIGAKGFEGRRLPESSGLVYIKNTSGSDRSRWDCMTLGNTTETIGTDGNESIIFAATTASADGTPVILQEPIANTLIGVGRIFGHTLAKIAIASSAAHLSGTPNASGHNLTPGADGPIQILSAPSTSAASVRPVLLGSSGGGGQPTRFFRYTLTADMGSSSTSWIAAALANLAGLGHSETPTGVVVHDVLGHASWQTTGAIGICFRGESGEYFVVTPSCDPDCDGPDPVPEPE